MPDLECIEFASQCLSEINPFYFFAVLGFKLGVYIVFIWGITKVARAVGSYSK